MAHIVVPSDRFDVHSLRSGYVTTEMPWPAAVVGQVLVYLHVVNGSDSVREYGLSFLSRGGTIVGPPDTGEGEGVLLLPADAAQTVALEYADAQATVGPGAVATLYLDGSSFSELSSGQNQGFRAVVTERTPVGQEATVIPTLEIDYMFQLSAIAEGLQWTVTPQRVVLERFAATVKTVTAHPVPAV
jgi:hypothetical protein